MGVFLKIKDGIIEYGVGDAIPEEEHVDTRKKEVCDSIINEKMVEKEIFEKYKDILAHHDITSADNLYWNLDDILFEAWGIVNPTIPDDIELIAKIYDELDEKMQMAVSMPARGVEIHGNSRYHYEPSYFDKSNDLGWIFFGCAVLYASLIAILGYMM